MTDKLPEPGSVWYIDTPLSGFRAVKVVFVDAEYLIKGERGFVYCMNIPRSESGLDYYFVSLPFFLSNYRLDEDGTAEGMALLTDLSDD